MRRYESLKHKRRLQIQTWLPKGGVESAEEEFALGFLDGQVDIKQCIVLDYPDWDLTPYKEVESDYWKTKEAPGKGDRVDEDLVATAPLRSVRVANETVEESSKGIAGEVGESNPLIA